MSTKTSNYLERDKKYLSPALARATNIVAMKAEGSFIHDQNGDKYLDMTSGIAVNQVGHAHPEVAQAIAEQAANCIHTSCVVHYPANIDLAEKLASIMPGDIDCTFFSNSGAEACDGAVKFAKLLQPGRPNIICHRGSFHGRSVGATSLTSSKAAYRKYYDPLLPNIHFVEYPNIYEAKTEDEVREIEANCTRELLRLFDTSVHPESVSAIFIEPVLGEGGYIPASNAYLKALREICDKYGILLGFDEVQCGVGRTGKWFATDHYDVVPDILMMAKGLSGGMPLGAFAAKHELMQKMPPGSHGSTFGGNPVSCRAALKLIEILERDKVIDNVNARSEQVFKFFEDKYPGSDTRTFGNGRSDKIQVRGLGLMLGLVFPSAEIATKVKEHALKEKVILLGCGTYGNIIRLAPDLTVSEENIQRCCEVIAAAL